jgi:hypothetical protein
MRPRRDRETAIAPSAREIAERHTPKTLPRR